MIAIASHLTAFLREHLPKERRTSPHTCEAHAHSFRILGGFAARRLGVRPYRLAAEQLDAPLFLAFLEHIEADRENSARTRNVRLAAISLPATIGSHDLRLLRRQPTSPPTRPGQ